jgi:hypothetical protein
MGATKQTFEPLKKKLSKCVSENTRKLLWAEYIKEGWNRKTKSFETFVLEKYPEVRQKLSM